MGVSRGLDGDYPEGYDNPDHPFTPAWQQSETGVDSELPVRVARELAVRVAREWAETAAETEGRCMLLTGSGALHWFHGGTLTYRAEAIMGIITGCMGTNGGGFNHYVGTEKVRPYAAVPFLGSAGDWVDEARLTNYTSYMYFHTDQHRYDGMEIDLLVSPDAEKLPDLEHAADVNALAVRNGWLPFYPQFDGKSSIEGAEEAQRAGARTDEEIAEYVRDELVEGDLDFVIENVDDERNHPKVMWDWRENLVGTSTGGHEYILKHLLGTHDNVLGDERAADLIDEVDVGAAEMDEVDATAGELADRAASIRDGDVDLPADPVRDGDAAVDRDGDEDPPVGVFRFLTPHGKWQIHSNFRDTWQMTNLSRGGPVAWINDQSADRLGIEDNDWVEFGSRISVDDAMRETLIADGCVVCDSPVSTDDFE